MPEDIVRAHAPRFPTLGELIKLKAVWGVSVASLVYRMHAIGALTDYNYRNLYIELTKRGYRTKEPNECPRESSAVLPKLLAYLYKEEGMTRGAIARELHLPPSEIESLLFGLTMSGIDGKHRSAKPTPPRSGVFRVK